MTATTTSTTSTNGTPKKAGPGKRIRRKFPKTLTQADLEDPYFQGLLSYLARYREEHSCGPTVRDIATELGWGYERVRCAVNHLVDSGWLTRQVGLGYRDMRVTRPEERAAARRKHWEQQLRLLSDEERECLFAAVLAHPGFDSRVVAALVGQAEIAIDLHTEEHAE